MRFLPWAAAVALGALLACAAALHPAVNWRLSVLGLKATGRLASVSTVDLLKRLTSFERDQNGGRWVMGTVTLAHASGEAPCEAVFHTPIGDVHAPLEDEFDIEWFVDKAIGLHKKQTMDGLMPTIEPGDVVIETGAWVGIFAKAALRYGAARVIAIEPVPDNVECMRRTLAEGIAAGRVEIVEAAAWSESGTVRMKQQGPNNFTGGSEGWNVAPEGDLEVRAMTIDEIVAELGLERVDLIEMDIEGSERHALAGAKETIRRFAPDVAACIHHLPDDPEAVMGVMEKIGADYQLRRNDRHVLYFNGAIATAPAAP